VFSDSHAALHCSCASNDDSYNTFNLHISALRQHSTTTTPQSTSLGLVFDYISATHYHTVEKTSQHHVSNRSRTQVTLCKPTAAVFDGDIKQEIISSQHLPPQTDRHCTGDIKQQSSSQLPPQTDRHCTGDIKNRVHHPITAPASTDRQALHRDIKQQRSSHHSTCLHRQALHMRHQTTEIISSQQLPPQTDRHCTGDIKNRVHHPITAPASTDRQTLHR